MLPNTSRSKGKWAMKNAQLVEYNKRNIFLQKLHKKLGRKASLRPLFIFLKSLISGRSKWFAA